MGWQERDYAKWTDAERARHVGSGAVVPSSRRGTAGVAVLVIAALGLGVPLHRGGRTRGLEAPPAQPAVVFGTGLAHMGAGGQEMTCTAMASGPAGAESCTTWQMLSPGQQAVQAAPLAPTAVMRCLAVVANQRTGRWTCTQGEQVGATD